MLYLYLILHTVSSAHSAHYSIHALFCFDILVISSSAMLPLNALWLRLAGTGTVFPPDHIVYDAEDIEFGTFWWFAYAGISFLLVLFAGIMSGLTLGLMSMGVVDLEILQRSGTSGEKKQAGTSTYTLCFCMCKL